MDNDFVRINIAFKPPTDVAEESAKISREINRKSEAYFVLDNENYFPHITVYSPEYPARNLEKVLAIAEEIAKNFSAPKFVFRGVKAGQGFVTLGFDYSEEIKIIHETLVEKLNPLRENHIREKYTDSYMMKFSEEKKENINKYGYPNSMAFYKPHMTLARLKDEGLAEKIAGAIDWPAKEFKVEKLGVYEMGNHGTCVKLVKEFVFSK
jgi:2'-5' RNA ligase